MASASSRTLRRTKSWALCFSRYDCGEEFKIGKYHLRVQPVPDPDRLDRVCSQEDEAAVREGIAAYFPEANGPTRRMVGEEGKWGVEGFGLGEGRF